MGDIEMLPGFRLLGVDRWGVDWTGWAEISRPWASRVPLRFPVAKYIVWC